jgi:hypothetical protein
VWPVVAIRSGVGPHRIPALRQRDVVLDDPVALGGERDLYIRQERGNRPGRFPCSPRLEAVHRGGVVVESGGDEGNAGLVSPSTVAVGHAVIARGEPHHGASDHHDGDQGDDEQHPTAAFGLDGLGYAFRCARRAKDP